ncbi:HHIP-like protein 2 [Labeo rohita]|uniref:HHIP-like protein 2 n=1 Tax=Labeo rohita TaxID=84645 RepID=A0ABQ8LY37_LABRO|nr:HHIP-like protein 2 [Labeo rohita]
MPRAPDSLSHHRANCPEDSFLTRRTKWLQGPFTRVIIIIYLAYLRHALAHPQCLDYQPPFKPPYHLEFCRHYEKFGCCDQKTDNSIAMRYWDIMDLMGDEAYAVCGDLVKDIMCQECSPYAAHLFDAEDPYTPVRHLPGLCFTYCSDFHSKCHSVVKYLTNSHTLQETCEKDRSHFCNLINLADQDYCYPNVLRNNDLYSNLGKVVEDTKGCLQLCLTEVANGLRNPVLMVHSGDDTHRMFVAEQIGFVWVYLKDGSRLEQPFLDISGEVLTTQWLGDERGFLGLAFHPKYRNNGRFFIYYSILINGKLEKIRISEMKFYSVSTEFFLRLRSQLRTIMVGSFFLVWTDIYTSLQGMVEKQETLLASLEIPRTGKVLRIDVDGSSVDGKPYKIPPDNPFVGDPDAKPEVYAYGVRNMWRCSVDRGDPLTGYGKGRIFCGDVGQNRYEEVDIIVKGGNYGWRAKEGFECFDMKLCQNSSLDDILPIFAYGHHVGKSVTGGYVYRGCESPNLNGLYIFGDFMSGRLMALEEDKKSGSWKEKNVCMGDTKTCSFPGLINQHHKFIISFAEDEAVTVLGISETPTRSPLEKIILPTKPPGTRQPTRAKATTSVRRKKIPGKTTAAKLRQEKAKKTTQAKEKQINVSTKTLKKFPPNKKSMLQTKKDRKPTVKPSHNPKLSIKGAPQRKKPKPLKPTKPNVWLQKVKKTEKEVKKPMKNKPKVTVPKKNQDNSKKTKKSPLTKIQKSV